MSCSNTPDLETGEIKTLNLLKDAIFQSGSQKVYVDARNLLGREQIDAADVPILFVELESGQNGTLTPYPGQGVGQTWLGADGATITLDQGVIKASRGMGDDVMGSSSSMPKWLQINHKKMTNYIRKVSYITGNNKLSERLFECTIKKINKKENIKIWNVEFWITKFEENCSYNNFEITNIYYLDDNEIVRQSNQYHSETLGYIFTQRLDR